MKFLSSKIIHYRWLILLITGIITIGNYYCYDIPSVLFAQLSEYFSLLSLFDLKFNLLYILYSSPNIFIPLFGGYLIDSCGKRTMILLFSFTVFCGQFIVSIGCSLHDFNMILFGRFIFGLGGESLMVSITTLLTSWFEGKELAFSLSLMFSFARLGSAGNAFISPFIAYDKGIAIVFWFGTLLCFFSFVSTMLVVVLDQLFKSPYETSDTSDGDGGGYEFGDMSSDDASSSTVNSNYYPDQVTFQNTITNSKIGKIPLTLLPPLDPHLADYQGPSSESPLDAPTPSLPPLPLSAPPPSPNSSSSSSPPHRKGQSISFHDSVDDSEETKALLHTVDSHDSSSLSSPSPDEGNSSSRNGVHFLDDDSASVEEVSPREYFTLADLQSRKKPLWPPHKNVNFWLVLVCCSCVYAAIIPFVSISNEVIRVAYYARRAEKHEEAVGYIVSR
jgi:hypothetical protein